MVSHVEIRVYPKRSKLTTLLKSLVSLPTNIATGGYIVVMLILKMSRKVLSREDFFAYWTTELILIAITFVRIDNFIFKITFFLTIF